ncbi:hypothetical protein L3X38_024356 [Prunus dulcis]|uniref:Non-ATPase subunit 9 n=1 Tax=Prunus dulcis TaxID=3755 RepID=A0AAD4Z6Y6_PRUDU|nr:hypothetical protein L3X38_024356 [Prunus dulcis]
MISKSQSKEAQASKGQGKDIAYSKAQMGESKYVPSNPVKKMTFTSSSEKNPSSTTFDEVTKSTRGINTLSRVVKRKIQKIKPVVEVPLVDKKWTQLPKDLKEQIWEAVQMAYVVREGGKKMVLSSAAKKWKDFKSTLTRQFILPFANENEKLKEPPQLYNFIEKSQWDAFVASRLSQDFEAVHSEQSQRMEKCDYNHRLS